MSNVVCIHRSRNTCGTCDGRLDTTISNEAEKTTELLLQRIHLQRTIEDAELLLEGLSTEAIASQAKTSKEAVESLQEQIEGLIWKSEIYAQDKT